MIPYAESLTECDWRKCARMAGSSVLFGTRNTLRARGHRELGVRVRKDKYGDLLRNTQNPKYNT